MKGLFVMDGEIGEYFRLENIDIDCISKAIKKLQNIYFIINYEHINDIVVPEYFDISNDYMSISTINFKSLWCTPDNISFRSQRQSQFDTKFNDCKLYDIQLLEDQIIVRIDKILKDSYINSRTQTILKDWYLPKKFVNINHIESYINPFINGYDLFHEAKDFIYVLNKIAKESITFRYVPMGILSKYISYDYNKNN